MTYTAVTMTEQYQLLPALTEDEYTALKAEY